MLKVVVVVVEEEVRKAGPGGIRIESGSFGFQHEQTRTQKSRCYFRNQCS